jgi:hypothetical protein
VRSFQKLQLLRPKEATVTRRLLSAIMTFSSGVLRSKDTVSRVSESVKFDFLYEAIEH